MTEVGTITCEATPKGTTFFRVITQQPGFNKGEHLQIWIHRTPGGARVAWDFAEDAARSFEEGVAPAVVAVELKALYAAPRAEVTKPSQGRHVLIPA